MVDTSYLNTLQELENKYNVELIKNEKVLFAEELPIFGDNKDRLLARDSEFTLTNKRIIIYNEGGYWIFDIADDISFCTKIESGRWFFKTVHFSITLKKEVFFNYGKNKLHGLHLYFKDEAIIKFEEIIDNLFNI
jgi:hypothetical protein